MPAVSLATLPSIPYVYSGTTPAVVDTVQLVTLPSRSGVRIVIHNRDKASKPLRISFDSTLTQGGAAPSLAFTIGEPLELGANQSATSGFQHATQIALFSPSASVNYELLFLPG